MSRSKDLNVQVIILASGRSTRFESGHKLSYAIDSQKMLDKIISETHELTASKAIAVCSSETKTFLSEKSLRSVILIENRNVELGMIHSIQQGLQQTSEHANGFMIVLGDMPYLTKSLYSAILEEFQNSDFKKITYPTVNQVAGHPVCFPIEFKSEVLRMSAQDRGLKDLILSHSPRCQPIISNDISYLKDIDTLADLL